MLLTGKVVTFEPEDLSLEDDDDTIPLVWDFNSLETLENIDWIIPEENMSEKYAVLETETQLLIIGLDESGDTTDDPVKLYLVDKYEL